MVFAQMPDESLSQELDQKVKQTINSIRQYNGVVVALSAGVDSSLVAELARRALGERSVAVTAISESFPPGELDVARKTAAGIGIRHLIIHTDELHNPNYASNPSNRCFYCKDTLYRELTKVASDLGFEAILDGTQADDLSGDRPGRKAAENFGVKSPLLEAGFSKRDVRNAARDLGLSIWDKPAMPCLSSRIPHGEEITSAKLSMVGQAELFIKSLTNVKELRVRSHNGQARIEVAPEELYLFYTEAIMESVNKHLTALGFSAVTLDLGGYRKRETNQSKLEDLTLPMAGSSLP
jgi:pyridinium-3,5-biscarboxylic acid mononucleotide sulfurtransferase